MHFDVHTTVPHQHPSRGDDNRYCRQQSIPVVTTVAEVRYEAYDVEDN